MEAFLELLCEVVRRRDGMTAYHACILQTTDWDTRWQVVRLRLVPQGGYVELVQDRSYRTFPDEQSARRSARRAAARNHAFTTCLCPSYVRTSQRAYALLGEMASWGLLSPQEEAALEALDVLEALGGVSV